MDALYPLFARANKDFYDHPGSARDTQVVQPLSPTKRDRPSWEQRSEVVWTFHRPARTHLPEQGWKIHLSATPAHAQEALDIAAHYCRTNNLPFKHLATWGDYTASNAKDAPRASAGKFVTIYPPQSSLQEAVEALGALTAHLGRTSHPLRPAVAAGSRPPQIRGLSPAVP